MNALTAAAVFAGASFVLSLAVSLLATGIAYGRLGAEVRQLQEGRAELATKAQVDNLAVQVGRIEGMFTMTLKSEHGTSQI